ncbi:MAG: PD-(D/E)XK nuclease family protein, partial [Chthoniobacterales bacterium]
TEFPFLWRIDDQNCLEGVIDLFVLDLTQRRALLIDWKTNAINTKRVASLREKYRSQIAAYWKAVSEITSFEVQAALYSTATGQLLPFEPAELASEWHRLAQLPPNELRTTLDDAQ